ncbi:Immunity protein 17 [Saccharicrinis carchari]|uniref:Immunity protein 17 n=1 Tax=Saccharicrinis carchari TaxID=1168039 RepID=A0A521DIT3_SACCC|nr:Imm17 family immunity protein [Saccharicrinis carchari]SMO71566.1 Immunity protein 17 [Saccharicrinis carchari]
MEQSVVLNGLFLFFGLIILIAALFNWHYFFNQRKAQFLVKALGINGARIVYAILGLFFALLGANELFNLNLFLFN